MEKQILQSINKRLGVMVSLLLDSRNQNLQGPFLREKIRILNDLGLKPSEIADILGRTNKYINKELSESRKAKRQKKEKYEEKEIR